MIRLITSLVILAGVLSSCSSSRSVTANKYEAFDLEKELVSANYDKIRMIKSPSGHLVVDVILNGIKAKFLLDTGAGVTILEEERKIKFNLIIQETDEKAAGAGGAGMEMKLSPGNKLYFNKLGLEDFELLLMDLEHVNGAFRQMGIDEIDGVIGADILTNHEAIIDYNKLILYLKR